MQNGMQQDMSDHFGFYSLTIRLRLEFSTGQSSDSDHLTHEIPKGKNEPKKTKTISIVNGGQLVFQ